MKYLISTVFLFSFSILVYSQTEDNKCDTLIYFLVEQMPQFIGDFEKAVQEISAKADPKIALYLDKNNRIQIIINCKGQIEASSTNINLGSFCQIIENELNKLIWIPGKKNGKNVSVMSAVPIRITNNSFSIPEFCSKAVNNVIRCKVIDSENKTGVPNARIFTAYNKYICYTNEVGEVEIYCEPDSKIEISHLNYLGLSFETGKNDKILQIELQKTTYELNPLNLQKYDPKNLPYNWEDCHYEDWNETNPKQNFIIISPNDYFAPEMAEFGGKFGCFYNYVTENFVFPQAAFNDDYTATTTIRFSVSETGTIKDVNISNQLNYGIKDQLINLLKNMPKWKPATQGKHRVEQHFKITITLGKNKYWKKRYN